MDEKHVRTAPLVEADEKEDMEWVEAEQATPAEASESLSEPLLSSEEIDELKTRWNSIQIDFVDEPRTSVEQADALVAEAMEKIARMFAENRAILDEQWSDHKDVSTEDLRIALQRYRSFFNRLLTL